MTMRPKIIFATPILSHPPIGGPELRIENSIRALSQVGDVVLYSRKPPAQIGGDMAIRFYKKYCKEIYFLPDVTLRYRLLHRVQRKLATLRWIQQPPAWQDHHWAMRDLLDIVRREKPDLIWLGFGNISYQLLCYLKKHANIPVVSDADCVWSRFVGRELPYIESAGRRAQIMSQVAAKEVEEKNNARLADITTAVSPVDEAYFRQYVSDGSRIKRFSNVIDISAYTEVPAPAPDLVHPCVYIAGSFYARGCPMEHAARWYISEVLPLIRNKIGSCKTFIVGKGSDVLLSDVSLPDVVCAGFVPSVLPYLCHADVIAVPLWFESGTRFKILEAGACRRAVVSTTLGAEGLPVLDQRDVMIADTPETFAEAICRALSDASLSARLGENLFNLVSASNGIPALVDEAKQIIQAIQKCKYAGQDFDQQDEYCKK